MPDHHGRPAAAGPAAPLLVVGFGAAVLGRLDPVAPEPVWVVEEPDVIRKRGLVERAAAMPVVARLLAGRYVDRHDGPELEAELTDQRLAAVVPGVEYAVPAAAALAEVRGLRGAGVKAATILRDKIELRRASAAAGIRNPAWVGVSSADDLAQALDRLTGPQFVLKPANRQASLGVQIIDRGTDPAAAWRLTTGAHDGRLLPDRSLPARYLVEDRIVGPEVSVECLVADGEPVFLNLTDKVVARGDHPVELGHVIPGPLAGEHAGELRAATEALIAAVGFGSGVLHAEWILSAEGPTLVECAGRVPGDHIVDLIDLAYEASLVGSYVDLLRGRDAAMPDAPARAAAVRFVIAAPGRVTAVGDLAAAAAVPGVVDVGLTVAPGDTVADLRSSWDRLGHIVAVGDDPASAVAALDRAAGLAVVTTCG